MKPAPPTRRSSSVISNEQAPPLPSNMGGGSNSTTPRSSMENLPPPPPHLLHSDDDDPPPPPPPPSTENNAIIAQRARSVAESVKALQISGHMPCSPKSLRRAHSMMAGPSGGNRATPPKQEQIYAPVAHLQQKIQQRQQQQFQQHHPPPIEAEQYGFGIQFQQSQSQYYQQMVDAGLPMQSPPEMAGHLGYGTANHEQVGIGN